MLILVLLVFVKISVYSDLLTFRLSFRTAMVFISNMYFPTMDTYFGASAIENPFLHTWTLAIEMQFYLFLPFLLFFIPQKFILPFIIILTIALFAYGTYEIFGLGQKNEMYFSLVARAPEFLMGTILAIVPYNKVKLSELGGLIISVLGLALIVVSTIFISEHSMFPGALAIVPCLGVSLLIIAPQNKIRDFLSYKVLFLIGNWSYSIYLWHWPIMAAFRYYYSVEEFEVWQYFAVIILTIILSLASYYLIENPLKKSKIKVLYPAVLLLFGFGFGLYMKSVFINGRIGAFSDKFYTHPNFEIKSHNMREVEVLGDSSSIYNKIFLTGNSHANNLKLYMGYIGENNNFSFQTNTRDKFAPIEGFNSKESSTKLVQYLLSVEYVKPYMEQSNLIFFNYSSQKKYNDWYKEPLRNLINPWCI